MFGLAALLVRAPSQDPQLARPELLRPDLRTRYKHIDSLFGDNAIDWDLLEKHCSVVKSIVGLKCVGSGELAGGASVLRKRRAGSDAGDAVLAHLAQSPRDARGAYRCGEPMRRLRLLLAAGKTGMAVIAGGGRAVPVREAVA